MIPPGLEPGTLRVLGARDNHYTTESHGWFSTCMQHIFGARPADTRGMTGCEAISFGRILFTPMLSTRPHSMKHL